MCISADQNGARLIKMTREEIGLQPRSKVILRHTEQDFDTMSSEVFLFSPFFRVPRKTSVIRVTDVVLNVFNASLCALYISVLPLLKKIVMP